MKASPTVRVQVVLFRQSLQDIWSLAKSVAAAARIAVDAKLVRSVTLALGDSTPSPTIGDADVGALGDFLVEQGVEQVSYTFFDANLGSSGGSNALAEGASEDFILVLNPDTYPAPTLLGRLLAAFQDPSVGAADARQIPLEHPKEFDPATGDTSWGSGSCLLIRADVFQAVGGFDSKNFFLYCDDVDLSWRVRLRGHRVVHVPDAVVFHDKRLQTDGSVKPAPLENFYGTLGRLMLARKYGRPDVVEETLAYVDADGSADHKGAAAEWRRRLDTGDLPPSLPGAERVAQFVDGNYARHRF